MPIYSELLWLYVSIFFHREGERWPIVCPQQQKKKRKKKSLFLNFQRAQITQRKQKQEMVRDYFEIKHSIFFLDIKKMGEFQTCSEFPVARAKASWFVSMENALFCLDSSCIFPVFSFQEESSSSTWWKYQSIFPFLETHPLTSSAKYIFSSAFDVFLTLTKLAKTLEFLH